MKNLVFFIIIFISTSLCSQPLNLSTQSHNYISCFVKELDEIHLVSQYEFVTIDMNTLNIKTKTPIDSSFYLNYSGVHEIIIKDKIYLLERNGGMIFELNGNQFKRIDNSFTHKMQINSSIFSYNDTIFRYGGYGFWENRNFFTFYNFIINEWEKVEPINTKVLPQGSMNSIVQIIDDEFYVYGGEELNPFNSNEMFFSDKLWKFNIRELVWEEVGELKIDFAKIDHTINYGDKVVLFDIHSDEVMVIDIKQNHVSVYRKSSLQSKLYPHMSNFYDEGIFYCFLSINQTGQIQLVKIEEEEFFGKLIRKERFYYNNETIFFWFKLSIILLLIIGSFLLIRRYFIFRGKIIVSSNTVKFKGRSLEFKGTNIRVLRLLLESKEDVDSIKILNICENNELNYAHNTRVRNELIERLNIKLKSLLGKNQDIITYYKSKKDKRIKVYSIDKSYFIIK